MVQYMQYTCNAYCINPVGCICKIDSGGGQNSPPCLFNLQVAENIQIASLAMIAAQVLLESKTKVVRDADPGKDVLRGGRHLPL